jgi:hypothetical protein
MERRKARAFATEINIALFTAISALMLGAFSAVIGCNFT